MIKCPNPECLQEGAVDVCMLVWHRLVEDGDGELESVRSDKFGEYTPASKAMCPKCKQMGVLSEFDKGEK